MVFTIFIQQKATTIPYKSRNAQKVTRKNRKQGLAFARAGSSLCILIRFRITEWLILCAAA